MKQLVLVALGGALGSVLRYMASMWVNQLSSGSRFPWGTLSVNLAGCALAGLVALWAEKAEWFSADHRLLLMTGVLGGFTTFSAFGLETMQLLRQGEVTVALAYVVISVTAGVSALWAVYALGR
ncbi:MAG: fluoride efflux transporter CrcB [Pseudomonadota bacterium]|jgi:CrcB protein